jgi:hypothetical protein
MSGPKKPEGMISWKAHNFKRQTFNTRTSLTNCSSSTAPRQKWGKTMFRDKSNDQSGKRRKCSTIEEYNFLIIKTTAISNFFPYFLTIFIESSLSHVTHFYFHDLRVYWEFLVSFRYCTSSLTVFYINKIWVLKATLMYFIQFSCSFSTVFVYVIVCCLVIFLFS